MPQSLELSSVCIVEATGKVVKEVKVETHPEALAKFFKDFGLDIVRHDEVCRRFMTTPSVGAIVAITYKSALDDPNRIKKSRNAGPLFGLTPKRYQSGETDITGGISRVGDQMVRTALYEAANVLLSRVTRFSAL